MVQIVDVSAVIVEVKTVETVWQKLRKVCRSMLQQPFDSWAILGHKKFGSCSMKGSEKPPLMAGRSASIFTIRKAKSTFSMWEELSFLMRLG
jgi:hypothetical protein